MAISRAIRKINTFIRRIREAENISLTPPEVAQLNFYQFKKDTAEFFYRRYGRTAIKLVDTPHFALADSLREGKSQSIMEAEEYYRDYLRASWGDVSTNLFDERVSEFRSTFDHYKSNGFDMKPILTMLPTDSSPYVVDGNHRTAMAAALEKPIGAALWPADLAFQRYARVDEFYGTGYKNMPYQSILLNGKVVVPGRRDDLQDRLSMLPEDVIKNRSILDIACNVGMSSLLARSMGAKSCLGLEVSAKMVDIATRFAMFNGAYPAVSYRDFNLDDEELGEQEVFDTAFMFSIYAHLRNPNRLLEIANRNVEKFVIFEGHPGQKAASYEDFFKSGLFRNVTELGRLHMSRFKQDSSRILWLCEK